MRTITRETKQITVSAGFLKENHIFNRTTRIAERDSISVDYRCGNNRGDTILKLALLLGCGNY